MNSRLIHFFLMKCDLQNPVKPKHIIVIHQHRYTLSTRSKQNTMAMIIFLLQFSVGKFMLLN